MQQPSLDPEYSGSGHQKLGAPVVQGRKELSQRCTSSHSQTSQTARSNSIDGWSIGSPALSITSVDPTSPSLRFKEPSTGPASDFAVDPTADLQEKASNYLQYIESLSQAYESQLKATSAFFRSWESRSRTEQYADDPRVEIVEVNNDGSRHLVGIDDVDTLIDYFSEQSQVGCNVVSTAILVERLTPEIISVIGAKMDVEPQFWDAHLDLARMKKAGHGQLVRFGAERASRVSFLNIPVLRRIPSLEGIDTSSEDVKLGDEYVENDEEPSQSHSGTYEGCSVLLDFTSDVKGPSTGKSIQPHFLRTEPNKSLITSIIF